MFNEQWHLTCSFPEKLWEEGFSFGFKSEKYLLDSWFEGITGVVILIFFSRFLSGPHIPAYTCTVFFSRANVIKKKLDACLKTVFGSDKDSILRQLLTSLCLLSCSDAHASLRFASPWLLSCPQDMFSEFEDRAYKHLVTSIEAQHDRAVQEILKLFLKKKLMKTTRLGFPMICALSYISIFLSVSSKWLVFLYVCYTAS